MSLNVSVATATGMAGGTGLQEQFATGFLYLFAGPVPATADEALDMINDHTQVLKVSVGGDGTTGLSFDTPSNGVLGKAVAQTWSGTVAMDGAQSIEPALEPTFYRFCTTTDDGRGAASTTTGYRVQGTVGGPNSGADLQLGSASLTSGNVQPVGAFGWRVGGA